MVRGRTSSPTTSHERPTICCRASRRSAGSESHVLLARWAADCAERVLHSFTRHSNDRRPQAALDVARQWANGEVKTGVAMKASLAAHAAARSVSDKAAIAAARAAGQAVATAHFADHSMGALLYALKAREAARPPLRRRTKATTGPPRPPAQTRHLRGDPPPSAAGYQAPGAIASARSTSTQPGLFPSIRASERAPEHPSTRCRWR